MKVSRPTSASEVHGAGLSEPPSVHPPDPDAAPLPVVIVSFVASIAGYFWAPHFPRLVLSGGAGEV